MLDELQGTVETLKGRIRDHWNLIATYESRTRATLINPMLHALGWDVSNPQQVEVEPKTSNGWADYALLGPAGRPVAFVEAKKLAEKDPPVQQIIGYAVNENIERSPKVQYCVCTNGEEWRVYDVFSQDLRMKVSISTESTAKASLKLLCLWRESLSDGELMEASPPVISAPIPEQQAPPPAVPTPPPAIATPAAVSTPGWTPISAMAAPKGKAPPSAIRFPDAQETELKYWVDILAETAKWLYRSGVLTSANCRIPTSDRAGTIRYMLSPDGRHKEGPFRYRTPIAEGIYAELNFSPPDAMRHAGRLLRWFGYDPSTVLLKEKAG